jgi:short-subunit dehydrogenase
MAASTKPAQPQTALITGASSGIGRELAILCAAHGHHVVLVARSQKHLDQLAAELQQQYSTTATVMAQDLAAPGAVAKFAGDLAKNKLDIDILINNAGFGDTGPFLQADPLLLTDMIQLNIMALTTLTRQLAPGMVQRGRGRILNLASVAAFVPCPNFAVYAATKAYVLSWSVALNQELHGTGVSATALCPGSTKTNFASVAGIANPSRFGRGHLSAQAVAAVGYQAMMDGRPVVVAGWQNRLAAFATHLVPRALLARLNRGFERAHD